MELSAVLTAAPEGGFVAVNPETGTTTQGESVEEALANLREATELYLEEFPMTVVGRPLLTTFPITKLRRAQRNARDFEIINRRADFLNAEVQDALSCQILL
jgi:predicted RNase H-like HicB family nuclease